MALIAQTPLLVIRADADHRIGIGHVMRCLALAQAWQRRGGEAVFFGRIAGGPLRQRLAEEGIPLVECQASHPDPKDIPQITAWLAEYADRKGWLVLDGYHFEASYQHDLRQTGWPVLVIDDMAHLPAYHAHMLLNQNRFGPELSYSVFPDTVKLLGPRYLLLRQEFLKARPEERPVATAARRILVTLGGADPDNATLKILAALEAAGIDDFWVRVVVGPASLHGPALARRLATLPGRYELLTAVHDMPALMNWADLAITGGGTTGWELAYLGIPFATAVLAENQEGVATSLAATGVAVTLGRMADWGTEQLAGRLRELLANGTRRQQLRQRGRRLVDGHGADRVVRAMLFHDFSLRPARPADCEILFRWANDPETRKASFHPAAIAWPEHQEWFQARLDDRACSLYLIVDRDDQPLGQVRFEVVSPATGAGAATELTAVISIGLGPEMRGCGLAGRVIRQACQRVVRDRGVARIQAWIRKENSVSLKSFAAAGFAEIGNTMHQGVQATVMQWQAQWQTH